jgi:hypothetical protein
MLESAAATGTACRPKLTISASDRVRNRFMAQSFCSQGRRRVAMR